MDTLYITQDTLLPTTLEFHVDTYVKGDGNSIECAACHPVLYVWGGVSVHFENVYFPKTYNTWLLMECADQSTVTWNSERMRGSIKYIPNDN